MKWKHWRHKIEGHFFIIRFNRHKNFYKGFQVLSLNFFYPFIKTDNQQSIEGCWLVENTLSRTGLNNTELQKEANVWGAGWKTWKRSLSNKYYFYCSFTDRHWWHWSHSTSNRGKQIEIWRKSRVQRW